MHHPPPLPSSEAALMDVEAAFRPAIPTFVPWWAYDSNGVLNVFLSSRNGRQTQIRHWTETSSHEWCAECSNIFDGDGDGDKTVTVRIQVEFESIIVVRINKDALLWGTSWSHFSSRVTATFMLLQDYVDRFRCGVNVKNRMFLSPGEAAAMAGKERLELFLEREREDRMR
jgi:hypothetical protein